MSLVDVPLQLELDVLPHQVAEFLREADERISSYLRYSPVRSHGFVPSDYVTMYHALSKVSHSNLATGDLFCEWGSGFGVVAALASMLGFESYGIEIDGSLVENARDLAEAFDVDVEFIQGSLIPPDAEEIVDAKYNNDIDWLYSEPDETYSDLGVEINEFSIVFAYPWPGEETVFSSLFDHCAAVGALLLTYTSLDGVRLQRKT